MVAFLRYTASFLCICTRFENAVPFAIGQADIELPFFGERCLQNE
jgi:hypothetical protein